MKRSALIEVKEKEDLKAPYMLYNNLLIIKTRRIVSRNLTNELFPVLGGYPVAVL